MRAAVVSAESWLLIDTLGWLSKDGHQHTRVFVHLAAALCYAATTDTLPSAALSHYHQNPSTCLSSLLWGVSPHLLSD